MSIKRLEISIFDGIPIVLIEMWNSLTRVCNQMFTLSGAMIGFHDLFNINRELDPSMVLVLILLNSLGLLYSHGRIRISL